MTTSSDRHHGGNSGDPRAERLDRLLCRSFNGVADKRELRQLCWGGVSDRHRPDAWRLLLDYLPADASRRAAVLSRKREEYGVLARRCYGEIPTAEAAASLEPVLSPDERAVLRQVRKDVPRTVPDLALFRNRRIQARLERLLYVWARRHPAASYVQGMNDVAVPFFIAFLKGQHHRDDGDVWDGTTGGALEDAPDNVLDAVEADVYWCLSKVLTGIQDHYTPSQPGIHRMIVRLEDLLRSVEPDLSEHLRRTGVEVMHFAFRWMNCLLTREFPPRCVLRVFDAYLSEEDDSAFRDFHVYVCAALLAKFSARLQSMEYDELFEFLTHLPSEEIRQADIEVMLSQAHVWRAMYGGGQAHMKCQQQGQTRICTDGLNNRVSDSFSPANLMRFALSSLAESFSPTGVVSDADFLCYA